MPALFRGLPSFPIAEADWLTLTLFSQTWQAIGLLASRVPGGITHRAGVSAKVPAMPTRPGWRGDVAYLSADGDGGLGDGLGRAALAPQPVSYRPSQQYEPSRGARARGARFDQPAAGRAS